MVGGHSRLTPAALEALLRLGLKVDIVPSVHVDSWKCLVDGRVVAYGVPPIVSDFSAQHQPLRGVGPLEGFRLETFRGPRDSSWVEDRMLRWLAGEP